MKRGVEIIVTNGNLGRSTPTKDNIFGMILGGAGATVPFFIPKAIFSLEEFKALDNCVQRARLGRYGCLRPGGDVL
jgi:hypothetical protein